MNGVPLADNIAETGELAPVRDAFELLSKPTLNLSDDDLLMIANDLRAKRIRFLKGQADRPGATAPKRRKVEVTEESKELVTQHLLGELTNLKLDI